MGITFGGTAYLEFFFGGGAKNVKKSAQFKTTRTLTANISEMAQDVKK